jgi:hypothetical protein
VTGRPKTTGADIDRWLASAEEVFETTGAELRRLTRVQTATAVGVAAVLIGAVAIALRLDGGSGVVTVTTAVFATLGGGSGALGWSQTRRQDVRRRRREMQSLVDDVREVYPIVARREQWDRDRYQSVRARLARFPIEAE